MGLAKLAAAARHPRLALRAARGLPYQEIAVEEVARWLPNDPIVVEAGAADGGSTVEMAERWPGGVVHAFEPVPALYKMLERKTAGLRNVRRYREALSDRTGEATMWVSRTQTDELAADSSSLLRPAETLSLMPEKLFRTEITVATTTLADWASAHCVDRVDFLWLDMQGGELAALQAADDVLETARAVCMEVSVRELYVGNPLWPEVRSWMGRRGFRPVIVRIPRWFGNVLFVRDSR